MNILFCGDTNVETGIFMSVLSILKNTSRPVNVYILTASVGKHVAIKENFKDKLQGAVKEFSEKSNVALIDITEEFASYTPDANMDTRFTPLCMLRLFADKVKEIPDKILYLDTDVLCLRNFEAFYNRDITEYELVGVPDRYGKWFFGNMFSHNYLNSGVLLLNMKKIRATGLFERCRYMCKHKKMFMPDQSALNKLAIKKKAHRRYNEQGKIKKDTVFKHFTTFFKIFPFRAVTVKPWDIEGLHRVLKIYEFDEIINEVVRRNENE
ncbi:MAG: glycosyltransferase family 8 protein [Clostridia bacterium]|nr:glycosyltransferase family 8 protein [Clostridia bacterium]